MLLSRICQREAIKCCLAVKRWNYFIRHFITSHHRRKGEYSTIQYFERQSDLIHVTFITVYCCKCSILLLTVVRLLPCLLYTLDFIIGITYRVRYYLWFQASAEGLETDPRGQRGLKYFRHPYSGLWSQWDLGLSRTLEFVWGQGHWFSLWGPGRYVGAPPEVIGSRLWVKVQSEARCFGSFSFSSVIPTWWPFLSGQTERPQR